MSEEQRMILQGRTAEGHKVQLEQKADKDEQGFWLDIIYVSSASPDSIQEARVRPESVEEFAESNPQLFELVLSSGINVLVTHGVLEDEETREEFTSAFLKAFQEAAEARGKFFYGPVGTVMISSPEPPAKAGFIQRFLNRRRVKNA